ncbi:MAG: 2-polyprenyl-3-methyl-6-methoxy-1,4-benzoquinone monooxygenase [Thiohalomonadales bacterium]
MNNQSTRQYSPFDNLINQFDNSLRTLFGNPQTTERDNPAKAVNETDLSEQEKILSGRLMRINHCGEVAAQGLYQGQALTAKLDNVRDKMNQAAIEENDHLDWCASRIKELQTHTSFLNPAWYFGSFSIGAIAGLAGDKWSLGFVAETEHQVIKHLDEHLEQIASNDKKSRAILEQMKIDERKHATFALDAGAADLPAPVKVLMKFTSKIMTRASYWV